MTDPWAEIVRIFALLMVAASLVALATDRLRIPSAVGLLVLGLVAGQVIPGGQVAVTPDLVLSVLLPGLVFDAAYRTHADLFRWARMRILFLAVPGVVVTAAVVAMVLSLATGMTPATGFLVGAMVAATDPAAVVATFRRVPAPARLRTLVEGESLFNDGTGLVLFTVALRVQANHPGPAEVAAAFIVALVASVAIGAAVAWIAVRLLHLTSDHLIEATLTVAAAYGANVLAAELGQSGLLATAVAGLLVGSRARGTALSRSSEEALDIVWEVVAFILTALTFLVVGVATPIGRLVATAGPIVAGVVAIAVARVIVIYGLLGLGGRAAEAWLRRDRPAPSGPATTVRHDGAADLPAAWLHVLLVAGMRGAVTVALAIALPASLPDRDLAEAVTLGIVVVSLVGLGLAAGPLVPRLLASDRSPASEEDAQPRD